ncbi:hypothetical protein FIBSPDRAFT_955853 [Athelia psychrophila]|uniref:Uncharacterized protein n=1 Tax=Athelia psychrophila TaxID=1759441 RepID=A0A166HI83_9AGAM|nr:hypothetical protein FIBSPDRAFT_955853 [Fibularhizoctonia sp. CBS 109695]
MSSHKFYPSRENHLSNVNVGGDHITLNARDVTINYHMHAPAAGASTSPDHKSPSTTGATAGDESGTFDQAAQHPNVAEIPTHQQKCVEVARALSADVLRIVEAPVKRPAPGRGNVLGFQPAVSRLSSCLFPGRRRQRLGRWKIMLLIPGFLRRLSAVPELELSGVIVDPGESSFVKGDEVFRFVSPNLMSSDRGALAQYVLMKVLDFTASPLHQQLARASPCDSPLALDLIIDRISAESTLFTQCLACLMMASGTRRGIREGVITAYERIMSGKVRGEVVIRVS